MAIKTQSQLDSFDNGVDHGKIGIGKNMAFFEGNFLTEHDHDTTGAIIIPTARDWRTTTLNYHIGLSGGNIPTIAGSNNKHYWSSIFEISKPTTESVDPSSPSNNDAAVQYDSMNTTYEDILKNILWDVKTYLNWKNNLFDYNLSTIVEGTQVFTGIKYFTNKIYAVSGEYDYLSAANLSGDTSYINNLTVINELSAKQLSVTSHSVFEDTLSVRNNLNIHGNIIMTNPNTWISGYALGLKKNANTKLSVGNDQTPVYFNADGVPTIVSQTAKAISAQFLTDSNWKGLNVGTASLTSFESYTSACTVVKFVDGVPVPCNEIDFAHHAFWSDIGEKYLADKEYEPGTLVKFGGEKEITIADNEVNAIVSTHAFDLNAGLSGGTVICLCGRVPTKVIGKISKFDRIMLSKIPGIACKWDGSCKPIGRALESSNDEGIKLVECVSQFMV